jgi:hypothetical protein
VATGSVLAFDYQPKPLQASHLARLLAGSHKARRRA